MPMIGIGVDIWTDTMKGIGSGAAVPPFDTTLPAGAAYYALRRMRTTYAGSCLKVRRSSDSTTLDIGFSANDLDTASMLAFCGAGDGFMDTWYDQSGNAFHATQATANRQPQLVSSGALITTFNSKVSARTDQNLAAAQNMGTGVAMTSFLNSAGYTVATMARADAGNDIFGPPATITNSANAWGAADNRAGLGFYAVGGNNECVIGHVQTDTAEKDVYFTGAYPIEALWMQSYDGTTTLSGWKDGGTPQTIASASVLVSGAFTMNLFTSNQSFGESIGYRANKGYLQELVFWQSALSQANRNLYGANAAAYWGRTWTNT